MMQVYSITAGPLLPAARALDQGKANVNKITDWLINYLV
jgi:hypothetical protein